MPGAIRIIDLLAELADVDTSNQQNGYVLTFNSLTGKWEAQLGGAGNSGFSGYSGPSGFSGYSGISGFSGYSGSGNSGFSGYSGHGVPVGGNTGQVLAKNSNSDFDTEWVDQTGSGGSGFSGYSGLSGFSGYSGLGTIAPSSSIFTRGIDGSISEVNYGNGRTVTINRNLSGQITSVVDSFKGTFTINRDINDIITGVTFTP